MTASKHKLFPRRFEIKRSEAEADLMLLQKCVDGCGFSAVAPEIVAKNT